jgi:hypothetical protein
VKLIWLAVVLTLVYSAACATAGAHRQNAASSNNRIDMEFSGQRLPSRALVDLSKQPNVMPLHAQALVIQ